MAKANPESETTQLILYACPVGALAQQIDTYLQQAAAHCGLNQAHQYMPHCTLTGFFEDAAASLPAYGRVLAALLTELQTQGPAPAVTIPSLAFQADWHGLELESPGLRRLALNFRDRSVSPTRRSPIRPKDWLHLSLAYGFAPECGPRLRALAETHIDLASPVAWDLRFYERRPGNGWICHYSWPLASPPVNL